MRSEDLIKKWRDPNYRAMMALAHTGKRTKPMSLIGRQNISKSLKGKGIKPVNGFKKGSHPSLERLEQMRKETKARFLSGEKFGFQKGHIGYSKGIKLGKNPKKSIAKTGHFVSKETREKISLAHKGKPSGFKGKKQTEETKKKMRVPHPNARGENHHNWIKDRTQLKKSERKDKDVQYMYWRKEVRKRDINICRLLSNECKGRLESHHIFNWMDYPELRYVITNGITLCHFHHPRKWEEEKRMIPILQELLSVSKV